MLTPAGCNQKGRLGFTVVPGRAAPPSDLDLEARRALQQVNVLALGFGLPASDLPELNYERVGGACDALWIGPPLHTNVFLGAAIGNPEVVRTEHPRKP